MSRNKKKTIRKTKVQLEKEKNEEVIEWVAVVILAALLILALMRSGPVGTFVFNLQRYLFGDLFWLITTIAVITIFINKYNRAHDEPGKNPIPMILICMAVLILTAWLSTASPGMDLLMEFVDNITLYFQKDTASVSTGGGIAGALLYGLCSSLFARSGTIVVIVVLFVVAMLLLVSLDVYKGIFQAVGSFFRLPENEEKEVEKEEEPEEKDPANLWNMIHRHKEKHMADIRADKSGQDKEEAKAEQPVEKEDKPLQLMNEEPARNDEDKPYLTKLMNIKADGPTEEIPVVKIPGKVISDHRSPFIDVDELIDHQEVSEEPEDIPLPAEEEEEPATAPEIIEEPAPPVQPEKEPASAAKPKVYKMLSARDINRMLDNRPATDSDHENEQAAAEKGQLLISILRNFDIEAELIDTHIGPAVTQFEIKPDASVKISRILGLADNIKMALAAKDVRIEAPIPGRNAVGIEIPNVKSTPVKMKELLNSHDVSEKNLKDPLLFYLGKDLLGRTITCRLDKMPHLLIAGATGSGKSVCMNAIITSFLLRTNPEDVKLLLVDPKKVEFTPYQKIPHLIGPIINDPSEASNALKAIAEIMDERYNIFAAAGVRNIEVYNQKVKEQNGRPLPDGTPAPKKMPYIVVIIDELADLMLVAGKEVEASIQRITQLARAAGIHLIVATQRPSVDVITGIIKANIPSRIAFAVSSGTDSRTILDHVGAERLLGNGDMLYMPIGQNNPIRVQGVFVTDDEVHRIADEVSSRGVPMYNDKFILLEGVNDGEGGISISDDPLFEEVKQFVIEAQKASTSLLQRRFGIGYNRAARMIDALEENGIIGPAQGSKPREVYIKPDKPQKKTETGEPLD